MNLNLETLFNVKNKTAVVTGGSRGIGAMITEGFLANGCKVYITARKKEALEDKACLLYTSPSPRDSDSSRMPSSA